MCESCHWVYCKPVWRLQAWVLCVMCVVYCWCLCVFAGLRKQSLAWQGAPGQWSQSGLFKPVSPDASPLPFPSLLGSLQRAALIFCVALFLHEQHCTTHWSTHPHSHLHYWYWYSHPMRLFTSVWLQWRLYSPCHYLKMTTQSTCMCTLDNQCLSVKNKHPTQFKGNCCRTQRSQKASPTNWPLPFWNRATGHLDWNPFMNLFMILRAELSC